MKQSELKKSRAARVSIFVLAFEALSRVHHLRLKDHRKEETPILTGYKGSTNYATGGVL